MALINAFEPAVAGSAPSTTRVFCLVFTDILGGGLYAWTRLCLLTAAAPLAVVRVARRVAIHAAALAMVPAQVVAGCVGGSD
jgi:hypothetical protein